MKAYIGNYKSSFGTWQLTKLLFGWFIKSEDQLDKIHQYLDNIPILIKSLEYIDLLRGIKDGCGQDILITIDPWDTYNLDVTLANIISPALRQFKLKAVGYKVLDDEDLPSQFTDTSVEDNLQEAWKWALDEMIFAFDFIKSDDRWKFNKEDDNQVWDRVNRGLMLFGKYYNALWS